MRLVEACSKTLAKLTYTVVPQCKFHLIAVLLVLARNIDTSVISGAADGEASERSFDFSKFTNLQGAKFQVDWRGGGLFWISAALSTLRLTTAPRLSTIQLFLRYSRMRSTKIAIEHTGSDLRQVADEITRIEREFEGAVDVVMLPDAEFKKMFDTLNVRIHHSELALRSSPLRVGSCFLFSAFGPSP